MNIKEKKLLNLKMLTKRVQRNLIDRRSFIKGAVAVGLTASTAMLLYQAYDNGPNGVGTALAQEGLVRRLWPLEDMVLDTYSMWETTEGKSLVNVSRLAAHPYHVLQDQVWKKESAEVGVSYTLLDSAFDAAKEAENLDLAIARGFDVIMGGPIDPSSVSPAVKRAREAGQIFINYDPDSFVRPTLKYGKNFWDEGVIVGTWMGNNLPPGSKVMGAVGEFQTTAGIERMAGFVDGVALFDLELLAAEEGTGWSQEGGYILGRAMLGRFPDVQASYFGDDQGAIGFSKAATDLGRREDVVIVGADGLREGQEAVADGRLDMSVFPALGHGPDGVLVLDMAFSYLRAKLHGDSMEAAHITEFVAVTKENLAEQWVAPV